jgi:hypothetical protein
MTELEKSLIASLKELESSSKEREKELWNFFDMRMDALSKENDKLTSELKLLMKMVDGLTAQYKRVADALSVE